MVKNALRTAARLGLLTVEERRREGRRNLPNVVRVISREWLTWLARGPKPIGVKKSPPRITVIKTSVRARQKRSLLPEGSRRGRQCIIGQGRAKDREPSPLGRVKPRVHIVAELEGWENLL